MGMILALSMPAFMRCEICPPHYTAEECADFQRNNGCHACDRSGCWHASPACALRGQAREPHPDAAWGDTVPHMRETRVTCTADGSNIEGRLRERWWRPYRDVCFTVNDTEHFIMGEASGDQCNCLIDTLRQQLHLECDTRAARAFVQARHPDLIHGDYLELQHHWRDVIAGLAHVTGRELMPSSFKIVCVDVMFIGNGDVEGNGATVLYIARQNGNHFVPLLRHSVADEDDASSENGDSSEAASDGPREENAEQSCNDSSDEAEKNAAEKDDPDPCPDDAAAKDMNALDLAAKALEAMRALASNAADKPDDPGKIEEASDASSAIGEDEQGDDESASSAYDSDATDVFHLEVEPVPTWETVQDKDRRVAHILAGQMRRHPLMPPQPHDEAASTSFVTVQSGLKLPAAHCAFRGCCWTGEAKESIEEHVVLQHHSQLLRAEEEVYGNGTHYGSSRRLRKTLFSLNMYSTNQPLRNLFMGYYRQAIAEIERGVGVIAEENNRVKDTPHGPGVCQGVPIVGPSVDRRTFGHLREVYNDASIYSSICFVCAQRRTHTNHRNSLIQKRHLELFKPDHTKRAEEEVLRIFSPEQYLRNLCRKTFLHRFARQGTPLWNANFLGPMESSPVVTSNITLPAKTADNLEEAWEWRRLYQAADGGFWDLLCCPEDVECTADCNHLKHAGVDARHIVCRNCLVPVRDECYDFIGRAPLYASPMALANDNVIGYTYETILKYKVSWIEAAAAQPAWTTMMCILLVKPG